MAIETNRPTFGIRKNQQAAPVNGQQRPKSQFWLNIGYMAEFDSEEHGTEHKFISLPNGMALDDMEEVKLSGQNEMWIMFQSARNDLLAQLKERAEQLKPGEEIIIGEGVLVIQLRRVAADTQKVEANKNPLARKLAL